MTQSPLLADKCTKKKKKKEKEKHILTFEGWKFYLKHENHREEKMSLNRVNALALVLYFLFRG